MSMHTPGPWRLNDQWPAEIIAGDYIVVARDVDRVGDRALIAAAPEVLAACAEAYDWIAEHVGNLPPSAVTLSLTLQAAIAKAEGRS
jgi:hypothetical protein